MENQKKRKWPIAILITLLVVLLIVILMPGTNDKDLPSKEQVFLKAKSIISSKLKSPTAAKYPDTASIQNMETDSVFLVKSYVDAPNSFNVPIRTKWMVKIKYKSKDEWELLGLNLEKQ